jgi:glycerol-3-phosphate dehydrogenase
VAGVEVVDRITGARGEVRARVVVNAAGPWVDRVRRLEDPGAAPLLRPTKGAHVMVARTRIGNTHGITFTSPVDGRVMFVLPWGDFAYVGTTDTDSRSDPAEVTADEDDVRYLLRSANAVFPHAHLAEEDVVSRWAALRPLLAGDPGLPASAVSREHRVVPGPLGMLTVAGGKLTTYRRMAAEVVTRAVQILHGPAGAREHPEAATDTEPLPGGAAGGWDAFEQAGHDLGLPVATIRHLLRHHGTETAAVLNLVREDHRLAARLHPAHPALAAEVVHAARRELACRVDDVLARRLHLTTETPDGGAVAAHRTAELLGSVLGWDAERIGAEVARFLHSDGSGSVAC